MARYAALLVALARQSVMGKRLIENTAMQTPLLASVSNLLIGLYGGRPNLFHSKARSGVFELNAGHKIEVLAGSSALGKSDGD
jgi:hypothetical protein